MIVKDRWRDKSEEDGEKRDRHRCRIMKKKKRKEEVENVQV